MRNIFIRLSGAVVLACLWTVTSAMAQDFQKSYRLAPEGSISIQNVSGNIVVRGYDGESVNVRGIKEGRDANQVDVEDLSTGNRIELRVRYPHCNNCSINASVKFEVQVPRGMRYQVGRLTTASGDIEVTGTRGSVRAATASGDVVVRDVTGTINVATASGQMNVKDVAGQVNASSASGDVEVEISRLEGNEDMRFSSASGDVSVRLPSNLDAEVEMSTVSGSVNTNFPLEVRKERHTGGASARGRVGSGARQLRISSASGNVSLNSL